MFLAGTVFKFFVAMLGAKFDVVERVTDADVAALTDLELPKYTVLVPVFREANIVAQLVANLGKIDYPVDKLEVLVLIEEEDDLTRDAFLGANPPPHMQIVTIPKGSPQTKPRACNVGLYFATGEYLVIYDAEDTPDADQLKKAVIAFRRGGDKTVCIQASLNYFNAEENVLTRMFTLEYSLLVRLHAGRARRRRPADPAGRHLQPLPHLGAHRAGRLGPVQRDRGRRPRHPRQRPRLPRRRRQLDHDGGGQHLDPELRPAAQPLDQGLHADHARARAAAAAADPRDRAARGS